MKISARLREVRSATRRERPLVSVVVVGVLLATVSLMLLRWVPGWLDGPTLAELGAKDRQAAMNGTRAQILQLLTGIAAFVALIYTSFNYALARKTHDLQRQSQFSTIFASATGLLAAKETESRIGGLFSLGRLVELFESRQDRASVVDVVCNFVRNHAPTARGESPSQHEESWPPDLRAALTVLVRLPQELRRYVDLSGVDFRELDIASLCGSSTEGGGGLSGFCLREADLTKADLRRVNFSGADLSRAVLRYARLDQADLQGCEFSEAQMGGSSLVRAVVRRASFKNTDLTGANLTGVFFDMNQLDYAVTLGARGREDRLHSDPRQTLELSTRPPSQPSS